MQEEITNIRNEFMARLLGVTTKEELDELSLSYLGRKGKLAELTKKLPKVSPEERKEVGILINETKRIIADALESNQKKEDSQIDLTTPGIAKETGHLHLVTQAIREISKVFTDIGFLRRRYPEVEWDWYAFGALNFSDMHPARDEWETFLIDAPIHKEYRQMILTPHTSSGQVREMKTNSLPIRMINISKTYRRQSDISHVPVFHQFEGLVIDKDITITHLKGTLNHFAKKFFGESRKIRLRPYHFPFTEPSFEVDVSCGVCDGKGCKLCKSGWLELGGAGMVHPNVLKNGGIDPTKYQGFAFGWGVERTFMMKAGIKIPDIRIFYSANANYLTQF